MELERNIAYRPADAPDSPLHTLDIYHPKALSMRSRHPIVVFIHGGGWKSGDKNCFHTQAAGSLPAWFVSHRYVLASLNFSIPEHELTPDASIDDMCTDIARALKWLSVNGRRYGGRVKDFCLFGFSSGAHLASLTVSDQRYLKAARFDISRIQGLVCADVAQYDVPRAMAMLAQKNLGLSHQPEMVAFLKTLMGETPGEQKLRSPAHFIGPHLENVSFLVLSAGKHQNRPVSFSRLMSEEYCERLAQNGISARHRHFKLAEHSDFVERFEGPVSESVKEFLEQLYQR